MVRKHLDEMAELFRARHGHSPVFEQMFRMKHADIDFWLDSAKCERVPIETVEDYLRVVDERLCEQIRLMDGVPSTTGCTCPATAHDLDAIEARASAATPGPWEVHRVDDTCGVFSYQVQAEFPNGDQPDDGAPVVCQTEDDNLSPRAKADAAFIAAARADVPALVAEVRRLRAAVSASEDCARSRWMHMNEARITLSWTGNPTDADLEFAAGELGVPDWEDGDERDEDVE